MGDSVVVEMGPAAKESEDASSKGSNLDTFDATSGDGGTRQAGEKSPPKTRRPPFDISRRIVAEFVGTGLLVSTIIGSGIMGDALSSDDGVALLGNTLATWGILFVLITVFGPVSGAHFNPVVTACFYCRRDPGMGSVLEVLGYVVAQFSGGILGALVAHGMFETGGYFDGKDRDTTGELFSEAVATFGLLVVIFGAIGVKEEKAIPMAVGLYITAGYWFTSSTSFANPAVTVARSFTNSFASINPKSFGHYFAGQCIGFLVGLPFVQWMFERKRPMDALASLVRGGYAGDEKSS
eukprot:g3533.t1